MAKNALSKRGGFAGVDQERLEKPVVTEKVEKECISIKISKETRQRLKMHCVKNGFVMGDLVAKLIENYLKENE